METEPTVKGDDGDTGTDDVPWVLIGGVGTDDVPLEVEVESSWNMSEDEIYRHLGMASLGIGSVMESKKSMDMLMASATNTDAMLAAEGLGSDLADKGRKLFLEVWHTIRGGICSAYKDKTGIAEGKDLVKYLVSSIVAATAVSNPFLIFVITILVKKGMDEFCDIETGKPKK